MFRLDPFLKQRTVPLLTNDQGNEITERSGGSHAHECKLETLLCNRNCALTTAPTKINIQLWTYVNMWSQGRRWEQIAYSGLFRKGHGHLSDTMEDNTAPTPCPMMTKDWARPPSNFRSHTRSDCCSTEHAERLLVVQCMFLFKDFTQTARPDTEYRIYSSHYGNVQCHLAHE